MSRSRSIVSLGLIVTLAFPAALVSRDALAEEDAAAAEALFNEGKRLAAQGKWTEACPKFEESQRLDPGMGTLFQLANCHQHVARTASAWAEFLEVAAEAKASGQTAREKVARERANALESMLARLTIQVDANAVVGLSVVRDTTPVGRGQWNTPIPVDPGMHRIQASAPGKRAWTTTIRVGEATTEKVHIPALEDAPASAPIAAAPARPAAPQSDNASITQASLSPASTVMPPPDAADGHRGDGQRVAGGVVFGVGVAGLATGGVFGLLSKKAHDDSLPHCRTSDRCDATGVSLRDDAVRDGTIATVALAAGGAAAITGAVLWFTAPRAPERVAIVPNGSGFAVRGAF